MIIGVFDSGFGGLTVLRELLEQLPGADYLYLGDSARLPYGSKSAHTVAHYACSSARFLVDHGAELLVIACNTATALALEQIREAVPVPVIGVIEPGAATAARISHSRRVCVIGTSATISSHAYAAALLAQKLDVVEKACALLVPLVEEGWVDHPITEQVARIYLSELLATCSAQWTAGPQADAIVLGCTHYPLLKPLLARLLPPGMTMVDSAEAVAQEVALAVGQGEDAFAAKRRVGLRFYTTDSLEKFRTLGARFLGRPIRSVELVHLPE